MATQRPFWYTYTEVMYDHQLVPNASLAYKRVLSINSHYKVHDIGVLGVNEALPKVGFIWPWQLWIDELIQAVLYQPCTHHSGVLFDSKRKRRYHSVVVENRRHNRFSSPIQISHDIIPRLWKTWSSRTSLNSDGINVSDRKRKKSHFAMTKMQ